MTINAAEKKFFEWLSKNTEANIAVPSIQNIRASIKKLDAFIDSSENLSYEDIQIVGKDGHLLRLRYYQTSNSPSPLIIYFPGNGFVYDLLEANHSIISKIATKSKCQAIMVNYRLAPEYPYPNALEDALVSVDHIFKNHEQFIADKNKIIIAGFSSGANLAAVVTNRLRNRVQPSIFHQFLISGGYDYTNSLHEFDEFAIQDKLLSPVEIQFSFDSYCKESERQEPNCSPYWEKDLSGLPATTIMMAEYDGGRSQSEGYLKKLIQAGNIVSKIILPGQTHGTILYRKALSDGRDPSYVAAEHLLKVLNESN